MYNILIFEMWCVCRSASSERDVIGAADHDNWIAVRWRRFQRQSKSFSKFTDHLTSEIHQTPIVAFHAIQLRPCSCEPSSFSRHRRTVRSTPRWQRTQSLSERSPTGRASHHTTSGGGSRRRVETTGRVSSSECDDGEIWERCSSVWSETNVGQLPAAAASVTAVPHWTHCRTVHHQPTDIVVVVFVPCRLIENPTSPATVFRQLCAVVWLWHRWRRTLVDVAWTVCTFNVPTSRQTACRLHAATWLQRRQRRRRRRRAGGERDADADPTSDRRVPGTADRCRPRGGRERRRLAVHRSRRRLLDGLSATQLRSTAIPRSGWIRQTQLLTPV